jgi:AcrR family transcriptional regulator
MGKLEANKKRKKDALFQTAFELFTSKGLAKTTISDIVERAGVAKGTFYLYFKDKYDIRNKLVTHKTSELFFESHEALLKTNLQGFEEQIEFILEYILTKLEADRPLLIFIAKNLSWGVFRGAFDEKVPDRNFRFYEMYLNLLKKTGRNFSNPEMMLFTIIELVSSTCYSCILYEQPASMEEYKPYLHKAIRGIIQSFEL